MTLRQKKSLGQHFLNDEFIANNIVESLSYNNEYDTIVEVGVGVGVLTKYLVQKQHVDFYVIEIDERLVEIILEKYPALDKKVIHSDILKVPFDKIFKSQIAVIGNFPYQISSQIVFKILENKELIPEMVGMFQKEVAQRITATHGNKQYGILSVLVQAYYNVEYLFEVGEEKFTPPPKVKSAVIKITRKKNVDPDLIEKDLRKLVKAAFNQRRKTLRNALKSLIEDKGKLSSDQFSLRAEQLSVEDFIQLSKHIFKP